MSLDITLRDPDSKVVTKQHTGIFVRKNGQNVELTLKEAQEMYPDVDIHLYEECNNILYESNITHNLIDMAYEAKIYEVLWKPEEVGITVARDLIDPLQEGLHRLKSDPEKYKEFNPENGWGSYETLVEFVENLLNACCRYPNAIIEVDK